MVAPPDAAWLYGADAYTSVARAWLARDEPERAAAVLEPLLRPPRRLARTAAARATAALARQNSSASSAAARSAPSVSTGR